MMKAQRKGKHVRHLVSAIISVVIAISMLVTAAPQVSATDQATLYPNSATLESILNNRQFVLDTLMIKNRDPENPGDTLKQNPHFENCTDHFIYEDLLEMYEKDGALKALVDLYMVKSDLENYPIETLMKATKNTVGFMSLLSTFNELTGAQGKVNALVRNTYKELGGKFPAEEAYNWVKEQKNSDQEWQDYPTARLKTFAEGSSDYTAYEQYKKSLEESEDQRDQQVLNELNYQESACMGDAAPVIQEIMKTVENVKGITTVDGETLKHAKIYDVILNDIFTSEYTSKEGLSIQKDFEAKTELDECTAVLKNEKDFLKHMKKLVDLSQNNAQKILIEDYLTDLVKYNEGRKVNVYTAFKQISAQNDWFSGGIGYSTGDIKTGYLCPSDIHLAEAKRECEEQYLLHEKTKDYIKVLKKGMELSVDTLNHYYLIDTLVRENEYIKGVLQRTADSPDGAGDNAWIQAVSKYKKLIELSSDSFESQALISVLQTASEQADKWAEESVSELVKKAAKKAIISTGKDSVTRASIAGTLAKVSTVYTAVDILDDYIAGMQDAAEKIYEIKYLMSIQDYAYSAYQEDVKNYKAATDPFEKEEYASRALQDLQFMKQIKLRQIDDGYQTLIGLRDKTLAGWIAQLVAGVGGEDSFKRKYEEQKDALVNMMICPVGGDPYEVKGTVVVEKREIGDRQVYVGKLQNDEGKTIGEIKEFDLVAAGGLNITGTLDVRCDIRLPQLNGDGHLIVKAGSNPQIEYVNGCLTTEGDIHVLGSVVGSLNPTDENSNIEIGGDLDLMGTMIMTKSVLNVGGNVEIYPDIVFKATNTIITIGGDFRAEGYRCVDYIGTHIDEHSTMKVKGNMIFKNNSQSSGYSEYKYIASIAGTVELEGDLIDESDYYYGWEEISKLKLTGNKVQTLDYSDKNYFVDAYGKIGTLEVYCPGIEVKRSLAVDNLGTDVKVVSDVPSLNIHNNITGKTLEIAGETTVGENDSITIGKEGHLKCAKDLIVDGWVCLGDKSTADITGNMSVTDAYFEATNATITIGGDFRAEGNQLMSSVGTHVGEQSTMKVKGNMIFKNNSQSSGYSEYQYIASIAGTVELEGDLIDESDYYYGWEEISKLKLTGNKVQTLDYSDGNSYMETYGKIGTLEVSCPGIKVKRSLAVNNLGTDVDVVNCPNEITVDKWNAKKIRLHNVAAFPILSLPDDYGMKISLSKENGYDVLYAPATGSTFAVKYMPADQNARTVRQYATGSLIIPYEMLVDTDKRYEWYTDPENTQKWSVQTDTLSSDMDLYGVDYTEKVNSLREELTKLLEDARKINGQEYTAETFGVLTKAIADAEAVLNDTHSDTESLTNVINVLKTAIEGLQKQGCQHKLIKTEANAPTCNRTGNTEYWTCELCGKFFSDANGKNIIKENSWVIPEDKDAHSWNEPGYEWATDYSSVTATVICKNDPAHTETETVGTKIETIDEISCNKEGSMKVTSEEFTNPLFSMQEIPNVAIKKKDHTPAEKAVIENKVPATCTTAGSYDEVTYCSVCSTELTRTKKTIDAIGHDYGAWMECDATQHQRVCRHDATHIEKANHEWNTEFAVDSPATYTKEGTRSIHCDFCGQIKEGSQQVIPKLEKRANTMTVKVVTKNVKKKDLKKKAQTVAPITVTNPKGTVTYKITGGNAKSKKVLKVNVKTGKVTVKKKTKKGIYRISVLVTAAGTSTGSPQYKAGSKTVQVTIKVR